MIVKKKKHREIFNDLIVYVLFYFVRYIVVRKAFTWHFLLVSVYYRKMWFYRKCFFFLAQSICFLVIQDRWRWEFLSLSRFLFIFLFSAKNLILHPLYGKKLLMPYSISTTITLYCTIICLYFVFSLVTAFNSY